MTCLPSLASFCRAVAGGGARALLLALLAAAPLRAGEPEAAGPSGSPREGVLSFLEAARQGRWDEAAASLDVPPDRAKDARRLSQRLKAVLDRHAWIDPEALSASPEGDEGDGLPADVEEIARIPHPSGSSEPVQLVRLTGPDGPRWVFSQATVRRVDRWFDALGHRWIHEHAPALLLRPGPRDLLVWQWLALPLALGAALALGALLSVLTTRLASRLVAGTETTVDDEILDRLRRPVTVAWALVVLPLPIAFLGLYAPAEQLVGEVRRTGLLLVLFWGAVRTVDVVERVVRLSAWGAGRPGVRAVLPLSARLAKAFVVALAGVSVLAALGYPVANLIAGLGIGGVAVALASQKTVENLFGSVSLGVDQAFLEGDVVKVDDLFGVVETVGLRSTRIRTLDRTLVTIPNGALADQRIESYSARDRLRLTATIGLVYETTEAQMREILTGLERVLREQPKIWDENVIVFFTGFGDSSLNVDVMAWFRTTDWGELQRIRQDVFLAFMGVVEAAGSSFAFPTRTIHLAAGGGSPDALRGAALRG